MFITSFRSRSNAVVDFLDGSAVRRDVPRTSDGRNSFCSVREFFVVLFFFFYYFFLSFPDNYCATAPKRTDFQFEFNRKEIEKLKKRYSNRTYFLNQDGHFATSFLIRLRDSFFGSFKRLFLIHESSFS